MSIQEDWAGKIIEKVEEVESESPKGGGVLFGPHTLWEGAG